MGITPLNGYGYGDRLVLAATTNASTAEALGRDLGRHFRCQTRICQDGSAVLEALRETSADVLLLDADLAEGDGFATVGMVKALRPDCDVVVLASAGRRFAHVDAVLADVSDVVVEPQDTGELLARVLRTFREHDRRAGLRTRSGACAPVDALPQDRYYLLFELTMNGMLIVRPNTGTIEDVNRMFCELIGRSAEELRGRAVYDLVDDMGRERLELGLAAMAVSRRGALSDIQMRHTSGGPVWVDISVTFIPCGEGQGGEREDMILLACTDVSEQHEISDRLLMLASTDELTGLSNQRSFFARCAGAVAGAVAQRDPLSLLSMDLDNFKRCNDTHGHPTGDNLLRCVGHLIREHIRSTDEGFRIGGDEFAVLLRGADRDTAARTAERLRAVFMAEDRHGTTLSIGVAQLAPGMDARALVKAADAALYRAKASGKNAIDVA